MIVGAPSQEQVGRIGKAVWAGRQEGGYAVIAYSSDDLGNLVKTALTAAAQEGYPCGCPPDTSRTVNVVCRNADCIDYGTHRRGCQDDRCGWCGELYTLLFVDPFKGAR